MTMQWHAERREKIPPEGCWGPCSRCASVDSHCLLTAPAVLTSLLEKKKKKTSREDNVMPAGLVVSTPELFRLRQGKPGRKAGSRGCCFSLHWGSSLRGVSPTEMPQRWPSASELRKLGFLRRPWRVRFIQSTHTG